MYKAVIFDLDGTLVDSLGDLAFSMNKVLTNANLPTHDIKAYETFIGEGIKNLVFKALPDTHKDEESVSKYFTEMMEIYSKHCTIETFAYDGIETLLNQLQNKNMKLAVLSNKVDELTKIVVRTLFNNIKFELIYGYRKEVPRKPDPLGALQISKELSIPPNQILYVGDTGIDMETANHAGMYAVGVLWGYRSKDELLENGAKKIIEYPLELLELL